MTQRQDPAYDGQQPVRDAVALVVATAPGDEHLIGAALRHALEGTDRTALTLPLAQVSAGLVNLISQHADRSPTDLMRAYAQSAGVALDGL